MVPLWWPTGAGRGTIHKVLIQYIRDYNNESLQEREVAEGVGLHCSSLDFRVWGSCEERCHYSLTSDGIRIFSDSLYCTVHVMVDKVKIILRPCTLYIAHITHVQMETRYGCQFLLIIKAHYTCDASYFNTVLSAVNWGQFMKCLRFYVQGNIGQT